MEIDEFPSFEVAAGDAREISAATEVHPAYGEALQRGFFRLLRILPGDTESEVCCEIGQYTFDGQIPYTALSYVWGSRPDHNTIRLNGTRIYVRKNLWRFLQQARALGPSLSGPWWIDALSINQSDLQEKTFQVSQMPQIYSKATRVVLWLGPAYAGSDQAMRDITRPTTYWQVKRKSTKFWGKQSALSILKLCERPYWTRLWVFQELHLAKIVDLLCGAKMVSLEDLRNFLNEQCSSGPSPRVSNKFEHKAVAASSARSMIAQTIGPSNPTSLMDLMRVTSHLRCAEARDKVYALLGVAAATDVNIDADYTMQIPSLLNAVLKNQHRLKPPESISEVEIQCEELASYLNVPVEWMFDFKGQQGCIPAPDDSDMLNCRLGVSPGWPTLWWTSFYEHHIVEDLMFKEGRLSNRHLHDAARAENVAAVQLLLRSKHIDANSRDEDSRDGSALHVAAGRGNEAIVRLLLDIGKADPNRRDSSGSSPLHLAVSEGNMKIGKRGYDDVVELLLNEGNTDVDGQDSMGRTAIHRAATGGNDVLVKLLLNGYRPNVNIKDTFGQAPLHGAAMGGYQSVIKLLLDEGKADPDIVNNWGKKALDFALSGGHETAAQQLYKVTQTSFKWEDRA